jgi:transposase
MLFVGDDWAEDHHDVEIVDDSGQVLARRRLPEGLDGVTRLHALIGEHTPIEWADLEPGRAAAMVKVGIETDRGPWVAALAATGYEVFAINPMSVARYRERHSTSGAKSDLPRMRTCWPRSSGWTGPTTARWPATPQKVRRSS